MKTEELKEEIIRIEERIKILHQEEKALLNDLKTNARELARLI